MDTPTNRDDPLADSQILAYIKNPHTIETAEQCSEVIEALDRSIAHMEAQDASYQVGDIRRDDGWFKRMRYALAMRRNEKRRIERRSREIRGVETEAQLTLKTRETDAARLLKEQRLLVDAEARRAKRLGQAAAAQILATETSYRNRLARRFMDTAREILPEEVFRDIEHRASSPLPVKELT